MQAQLSSSYALRKLRGVAEGARPYRYGQTQTHSDPPSRDSRDGSFDEGKDGKSMKPPATMGASANAGDASGSGAEADAVGIPLGAEGGAVAEEGDGSSLAGYGTTRAPPAVAEDKDDDKIASTDAAVVVGVSNKGNGAVVSAKIANGSGHGAGDGAGNLLV